MEYEECTAIMAQFKLEHEQAFSRDSSAHGMRVAVDSDTAPLLEILIEPGTSTGDGQNWKGTFTYLYHGERRDLPTTGVEQERYRALGSAEHLIPANPPVKAGAPIIGVVPGSNGTLGLNLYLDNQLSCIGCWHVLCPLLVAPRPNSHVYPGGSGQVIATLTKYYAATFNGPPNVWDLAIAAYTDPSQAASQMVDCSAGPPPYPTQFATSFRAGNVYKVGIVPPICNPGTATAVVCAWVTFHTYRAWYVGQIECTRMTDEGDSGSLAIYQDTNEILGMHFAVVDDDGLTDKSLASPLYSIGWKCQGMYNGFPSYSSA